MNYDGTITIFCGNFDRPISLNFACSTACIVTLTGEVWEAKDVGELANHDRMCSRRDDRA